MKEPLERVLADLPELSAVLDRARERFISLGGARGTVTTQSREERLHVARLGCQVPRNGRVKLSNLDQALRASSINAGLRTVLEALGGPIVTREEERDRATARWDVLRTRMQREVDLGAGSERLAAWIEADARYLQRISRRGDAEEAEAAVLTAHALGALPGSGREEPLAHFAARLSGDAHAFDGDRTAGRLLLRALATLEGKEPSVSQGREAREDTLATAGIALDDLSSDVLTVGLRGGASYIEAARVLWHPIRLSLYALTRLGAVHPPERQPVFAVENPPVFRMLMERAAKLPEERRPVLVCTSGHLSLAARKLLRTLAGVGTTIRYSGDFDTRGVEIALRLREQLAGHLELWRMSPKDHAAASTGSVQGPPISKSDVDRVRDKAPELAGLLERATAHQERLTDALWEDVEQECTRK